VLIQSPYGFGNRNNGLYTRLGFLRRPLPYELLPTVQCFTVDDHLAWQLTQLETWYKTNGRDDLAQVVLEAKLGPHGDGTRPCIGDLAHKSIDNG